MRMLGYANGRRARRCQRSKPGLVALATSAIVAGVAGTVAVPIEADAAIRCKDGFQLSGGRWISTPYCEDRQLVRVAREFGVRTSFNAVRFNVSEKRRVCRVVGFDIRVMKTCSGFRRERRHGPRWFF